VAAADVLGLTGDAKDPVVVTGEQLTALAEACVEAAVSSLAPTRPFAVIAMGRFGGAELSYASDLDLLLVYDGQTAEHFDEAEKLAEALVRFLAGDTPAARIYQVDLDLRPEGKQGPLARTLEGYHTYYRRWGQTWERQALIRARPVAGDKELSRSFMEIVEDYVWGSELSDADVREIRRIKARVERERIPAREDPHFHLKLGPGTLSDVEFCVQLLQLRHGVHDTATMGALEQLRKAQHLADDDAEVLADAYRFCERTRNRWFLIKGGGSDALPSRPEQMARLARSLQSSPTELREDYRRVTRRCRAVVERLFYGKTTTS
jgi:glutamate-ammonia-ligase adenylyltransferase